MKLVLSYSSIQKLEKSSTKKLYTKFLVLKMVAALKYNRSSRNKTSTNILYKLKILIQTFVKNLLQKVKIICLKKQKKNYTKNMTSKL